MRGGLVLVSLFFLTATSSFAAPLTGATASQSKICAAIAASNHLNVASNCPKKAQGSLSFTVSAKAPAGYKATVAYQIIDTTADAQTAWQEEAGPGPELTLPPVGHVSGVASSYYYFAAGQDDAEATALVGTVVIDIILVPSTSSGESAVLLKSQIQTLLRTAAALVRTDEAHAPAG